MNTTTATFIFLATLCTSMLGCHSPSPMALRPHKSPIAIYSVSPRPKGEAICVTCDQPVHATGTNAGLVTLTVRNESSDSVFLDVTDFRRLGVTFSTNWPPPENDPGVRSGQYATISGGASTKHHGRPFVLIQKPPACGAVAWLPARIGENADLSQYLTAQVSLLNVHIHGYCRSNGEYFSGSVDVPFEIVK